MHMNTHGSRGEGASRRMWERPALRRLAADKAEGGPLPCNDSQNGAPGCGPNAGNHSVGI
jgi:hypothetical protein